MLLLSASWAKSFYCEKRYEHARPGSTRLAIFVRSRETRDCLGLLPPVQALRHPLLCSSAKRKRLETSSKRHGKNAESVAPSLSHLPLRANLRNERDAGGIVYCRMKIGVTAEYPASWERNP